MASPQTWPIAVRREASLAFVGIADRLGDGRALVASPEWPPLEQIAGDDWSARLYARILPRDLAWGWWTRTEPFDRSGLAKDKAPAIVDPSRVERAMCRRKMFSRRVLAIVPPDLREQERVLQWAAVDTEHAADILVTARRSSDAWNIDDIVAWCEGAPERRDPSDALRRVFERIVVVQDGFTQVALELTALAPLLNALRELARGWGIVTIDAEPSLAWDG
jgi:hypothetical protein